MLLYADTISCNQFQSVAISFGQLQSLSVSCNQLQSQCSPCFSPHQLTITVTDVNDNRPVCPQLPQLQVERTVDVGFTVVQLNVTDADIGSNAAITFVELQGQFNNEDDLLRVDRNNGRVSTSRYACSLRTRPSYPCKGLVLRVVCTFLLMHNQCY